MGSGMGLDSLAMLEQDIDERAKLQKRAPFGMLRWNP